MDNLIGVLPYIFPFLAVITILVFVHEMGHYLVARWNGVRVEVFSIGFGPEIFGWTDRAGTRWKFSLIPLGGYVRMYGDLDEASQPDQEIKRMSAAERAQTLHGKKPWQKIAVAAAGPAANYVFAIVVLFALYVSVGERYLPPEISGIVAGGAAEQAGIQKGDVVTKVNHTPIKAFAELESAVRESPSKPLTLEIERAGKLITLAVTPAAKELVDRFKNTRHVGVLGISRSGAHLYNQLSAPDAMYAAGRDIVSMSESMLAGLWQIIIGERSADELGGVLRIAKLSGDVAQSGMGNLVWLMVFLSVNLGLINLFPIPMLDGGHILIYTIEAVRGKVLGEKAQEFIFKIGFFFVAGVMVLSLWNDLMHLGIVKWICGLWG